MDANKIREIRIIRVNPRFRRYPEYKESGVEWIGKIPRHWETKAVWVMFRLNRLIRGRVISNEEMGTNPGQYPCIRHKQKTKELGYLILMILTGIYITWTTDGAKAGTVFYRNRRFNCTKCGTLLNFEESRFRSKVFYALNKLLLGLLDMNQPETYE